MPQSSIERGIDDTLLSSLWDCPAEMWIHSLAWSLPGRVASRRGKCACCQDKAEREACGLVEMGLAQGRDGFQECMVAMAWQLATVPLHKFCLTEPRSQPSLPCLTSFFGCTASQEHCHCMELLWFSLKSHTPWCHCCVNSFTTVDFI